MITNTLGINVVSQEPVTHISLPGRFNLIGQQKPVALIDLEIASHNAWKKYEESVDQLQAGIITLERQAELFNIAIVTETRFRSEISLWHNSFTLSTL